MGQSHGHGYPWHDVHEPPQEYSAADVINATGSMSNDLYIQESPPDVLVFKGRFPPFYQPLAVHTLNPGPLEQFMEEVTRLAGMRNPNLLNLVGYCNAQQCHALICEFIPFHSNLDVLLHGSSWRRMMKNVATRVLRGYSMPRLNWKSRMTIARDVARALHLLHGTWPPAAYGGLIRASNVLIHPPSMHVKIGGVRGTQIDHRPRASPEERFADERGYHAPEYTEGNHTLESDVFSFGVLLLELITGKKPYKERRSSGRPAWLVNLAGPMMQEEQLLNKLVDRKVRGKCSGLSVKRAVTLAQRCLADDPSMRPMMPAVLQDIQSVVDAAERN